MPATGRTADRPVSGNPETENGFFLPGKSRAVRKRPGRQPRKAAFPAWAYAQAGICPFHAPCIGARVRKRGRFAAKEACRSFCRTLFGELDLRPQICHAFHAGVFLRDKGSGRRSRAGELFSRGRGSLPAGKPFPQGVDGLPAQGVRAGRLCARHFSVRRVC